MSIGNIIEVISQDGHGKTYGVCSFAEEVCILDADGKAQKTIDAFYPDKLITVVPCLEFYQKSDVSKGILRGNLDIDKTMDAIYKGVSFVLDNMENFETIVVDGISDWKKIVSAQWLLHDPKHRKSIGENNLTARAEINATVRDKMIFPLVNTARTLNKTLILTSKMKAVYDLIEGDDGKMHNHKTNEKEPDAAEWVGYRMDIKVILDRDKVGKYWLHWERAPQKDLPVKEDITGKSLHDVMVARKVI